MATNGVRPSKNQLRKERRQQEQAAREQAEREKQAQEKAAREKAKARQQLIDQYGEEQVQLFEHWFSKLALARTLPRRKERDNREHIADFLKPEECDFISKAILRYSEQNQPEPGLLQKSLMRAVKDFMVEHPDYFGQVGDLLSQEQMQKFNAWAQYHIAQYEGKSDPTILLNTKIRTQHFLLLYVTGVGANSQDFTLLKDYFQTAYTTFQENLNTIKILFGSFGADTNFEQKVVSAKSLTIIYQSMLQNAQLLEEVLKRFKPSNAALRKMLDELNAAVKAFMIDSLKMDIFLFDQITESQQAAEQVFDDFKKAVDKMPEIFSDLERQGQSQLVSLPEPLKSPDVFRQFDETVNPQIYAAIDEDDDCLELRRQIGLLITRCVECFDQVTPELNGASIKAFQNQLEGLLKPKPIFSVAPMDTKKIEINFANMSSRVLMLFLFGYQDKKSYIPLSKDLTSLVNVFSQHLGNLFRSGAAGMPALYGKKVNGFSLETLFEQVLKKQYPLLLLCLRQLEKTANDIIAQFPISEYPASVSIQETMTKILAIQKEIESIYRQLPEGENKSKPNPEFSKKFNQLFELNKQLLLQIEAIEQDLQAKERQQAAKQKQKEEEQKRQQAAEQKERAAKDKYETKYFKNPIGELPTALPDSIKSVLKALKAKHAESAIVGGAIRDLFYKITPNDYDFITRCSVADVEEVLASLGYYCNRTNVPGLIKAVTKTGEQIDVQCITEDFEKNLAKKDCTINALICDESDKIYGQSKYFKDLQNKKIQLIAEPESLRQHPERILRLCRLSNHMRIELKENVKTAIIQAAPKITSLPKSVYHRNLELVFGRGNALNNFDLMKQLGIVYALTGTDSSLEPQYQGPVLDAIRQDLASIDQRVRAYNLPPAADEILRILARPFPEVLLPLLPVSPLFTPGFAGQVHRMSTSYDDPQVEDVVDAFKRIGFPCV